MRRRSVTKPKSKAATKKKLPSGRAVGKGRSDAAEPVKSDQPPWAGMRSRLRPRTRSTSQSSSSPSLSDPNCRVTKPETRSRSSKSLTPVKVRGKRQLKADSEADSNN
ncbi:hypothetical protein NW757_004542 [Fusarium falciforme]|nr:hypothetical protein NW757_004542 [Fusarium falciforme]